MVYKWCTSCYHVIIYIHAELTSSKHMDGDGITHCVTSIHGDLFKQTGWCTRFIFIKRGEIIQPGKSISPMVGKWKQSFILGYMSDIPFTQCRCTNTKKKKKEKKSTPPTNNSVYMPIYAFTLSFPTHFCLHGCLVSMKHLDFSLWWMRTWPILIHPII